MELKIDWDKPILQKNIVQNLCPNHLDDFYVSASEPDKTNLFFILLNSLHYYIQCSEHKTAAHLGFLISYYLFTVLTPPGSRELALFYIKIAIAYAPQDDYNDWLRIIEKGN